MSVRSGMVSLAIFGSRVAGLAREVVFAALFGAGAVADAYQVAFRVPNLLRDLFAEGALSNAFVPTFTAELHQGGPPRAHVVADLVTTALVIVTGIITTAALVWSDAIVGAMARGFAGDADKHALAVELTRTMLPILVLVSLAAVWMGMLNAQRRFVLPQLAPALFNAVSIAVGLGLLVLGLPARDAILSWAIGTTAAAAAQAGIQLVALVRMGYRPRPRVIGMLRDPALRRIVRLMAPAVVGIAAVNVNVFINTGFAAELGNGPVAQISYAFRLFFLPLGVFGVAIATITATSVSEEAARGDRDALARRTQDGAAANWLLVSASATGLFVLADPIVRLCFRWGATSLDDAAAIATVLRTYLIGLVPYALVKLYAPAFFAVDRPRIPMLASLLGVAVNLSFNALTHVRLGAPGIALGTTLGALVNVLVLRIAFDRVVARLPRADAGRRALALLVANLVLAGIAAAAAWSVGDVAGLGPWGVRAADATAVVLAGGLGFVVFTRLLARVDYPGAEALARLPLRLLRRRRATVEPAKHR